MGVTQMSDWPTAKLAVRHSGQSWLHKRESNPQHVRACHYKPAAETLVTEKAGYDTQWTSIGKFIAVSDYC
jgi:hypothetical protein